VKPIVHLFTGHHSDEQIFRVLPNTFEAMFRPAFLHQLAHPTRAPRLGSYPGGENARAPDAVADQRSARPATQSVYRYDSMRVDGFRVEVTAPRAPL
jgi:hypothetical protein